MKKKNLLALTLVAVLAFTLGMGTLAYYSKTFTSNDNVVRAARFDVDTNGTLDKDHTFDLDDDPMYPGRDMDVYNFEIHKNRTEVPVEYKVSVSGIGQLFYGDSPVKVNLMRKVGGKWEKFNGPILSNPEAKEEFKINLTWDHTNHDIDYQGKTGKINMKVVATQVDGEVEEPEPGPKLVSAEFIENALLRNFGNVKVEVANIEGAAKYRVKYFLNDKDKGRVPQWSDINNIDDYEDFIIYCLADDALTIEIYAEDGSTLLHTFEDIVLDIK